MHLEVMMSWLLNFFNTFNRLVAIKRLCCTFGIDFLFHLLSLHSVFGRSTFYDLRKLALVMRLSNSNKYECEEDSIDSRSCLEAHCSSGNPQT